MSMGVVDSRWRREQCPRARAKMPSSSTPPTSSSRVQVDGETDERGEQGVIRGESVVSSVRDDRHGVFDDERASVVIDVARDGRQQERQNSPDEQLPAP